MKIGELMSALGPTLVKAQPISHAEKLMAEQNRDFLTVTDRSGRAVGFITQADVSQAQLGHLPDWSTAPCSAVVEIVSQRLGTEDHIESAVQMLTYHGVRPLLVYENGRPVGVLEPTSVFQWCAEHRPEALDELAYIVSSEERSHYPDTWEEPETNHQ